MIKKLLSLIYLSIASILLFWTYYRSEIIYDGLNRDYYTKYYLLSIFVFCIYAINLKTNFKTSKKIFYTFCFVSTLSYSIEGYFFSKENLESKNKNTFSQLDFTKKICLIIYLLLYLQISF